MLKALATDLLAENRDLDRFVSALTETDWERPTDFFGWTVRDQILHLHQVDSFGLAAMDGRDAFDLVYRVARTGQAEGVELSEQARRAAAGLSRAAIMDQWRTNYEALVERLGGADAKARMPWFGPDMSLASLASARQMEVWAHGQDIYDLLAVRRTAQPRIRNICELGVRTFGWSFRNRGLEVPPAPTVHLTGSGGEALTWPGEGGEVRGTAQDFALVVTQRRPYEDTALVAEGSAAQKWLAIAQCFAGAPQQRARPGSRPPL